MAITRKPARSRARSSATATHRTPTRPEVGRLIAGGGAAAATLPEVEAVALRLSGMLAADIKEILSADLARSGVKGNRHRFIIDAVADKVAREKARLGLG